MALKFFSSSKIVGGDTYTLKFGQKSEKNHFFAHKNENISKSCCPILKKNATPIVFYLNSAYNTQFLNKSVQN